VVMLQITFLLSYTVKRKKMQPARRRKNIPKFCCFFEHSIPRLRRLLHRLAALPREDVLAVLVELQLGDDDLGGGNADGNRLAVDLLAGDTLDVNNVLETVDRRDLALTTLERTTGDDDLVVLTDGDGADLFAAKTGIVRDGFVANRAEER
jgi:hypothetical protein